MNVTVSPSVSFVVTLPTVVKLFVLVPNPCSVWLPLLSFMLNTWLAIVGALLSVTFTRIGNVLRKLPLVFPWCWSDALTVKWCFSIVSKSKLPVFVVITNLLPPDTLDVAKLNLFAALWLSGDIVMVSPSSSVTKNVKTVVPLVVFSLTLPVWEVIMAPEVLVVRKFGAVFGVTLIKIVAVAVVIVSLTSTKKGCANWPSPRLTVLKLALVDVFVVIRPLPLCILKKSAE